MVTLYLFLVQRCDVASISIQATSFRLCALQLRQKVSRGDPSLMELSAAMVEPPATFAMEPKFYANALFLVYLAHLSRALRYSIANHFLTGRGPHIRVSSHLCQGSDDSQRRVHFICVAPRYVAVVGLSERLMWSRSRLFAMCRV